MTWDPPVALTEPDIEATPEPEFDNGSLVRLGALAAFVITLGVVFSWWVVVAVFALIAMIFMHELGHYTAAKRSGMKVTEFFLGFGPRIWAFRRGETEFGLKVIPLGAYVKVIGMNNLDADVDPSEESRTYRSASYPRRLLMASAGSLMHFTIAFVLGIGLLAGYGQLKETSWEVGLVQDGTPAATSGLEVGDRIVSIDGRSVGAYQDFRNELRANPGGTLQLGVERAGVTQAVPVTLLSECNGTVGRLGIAPQLVPIEKNIAQAVVGSGSMVIRGIGQSAAGIGRLFSPAGIGGYLDTLSNKPATSTGPVACSATGTNERPSSIIGITNGVAQAAKYGLQDFLLLFIGVNLAIGVFNLIPMLPFDGGHIAIATYERVREIGRKDKSRYHADVAKLLPVVYGLVIVMAVLFLSASFLDITRGVN